MAALMAARPNAGVGSAEEDRDGKWLEFPAVGLELLDEAPMCVEVAIQTSFSWEGIWAFCVDATGWSAWVPGVEC